MLAIMLAYDVDYSKLHRWNILATAQVFDLTFLREKTSESPIVQYSSLVKHAMFNCEELSCILT